jgi:hypothetical protein
MRISDLLWVLDEATRRRRKPIRKGGRTLRLAVKLLKPDVQFFSSASKISYGQARKKADKVWTIPEVAQHLNVSEYELLVALEKYHPRIYKRALERGPDIRADFAGPHSRYISPEEDPLRFRIPMHGADPL